MELTPQTTQTGPSRLVVLATGGTIAGLSTQADDNLGYSAAQVGVAQLLEAVPPDALLGTTLVGEQVVQVDSKDMGWAVWQALSARLAQHLADPAVRGVLITHGTDTLEETAWLLHTLLRPSKPVVLTCAMRPANAAYPDGPQNLRDALALLHDPQAHGVLVVCAGLVHGSWAVTKRHPYRVDAFDSGEAGPLAVLEEGRVRWLQRPIGPPSICPAPSLAAVLEHDGPWPRVDIVTSHTQAAGRVVDLLVQDGGQGLVVAGTGNGTVHEHLLAALLRAQAAGVTVWRSTRCALGQVLPHAGDSLPDAAGLNPVKARLALMLSLLAAHSS